MWSARFRGRSEPGIDTGFEQRLRELESLLDELDHELWKHGSAPPRAADGHASSSADAGGEGGGSPPTVRRLIGTLLSAAAGRALTLAAAADRLSASERPGSPGSCGCRVMNGERSLSFSAEPVTSVNSSQRCSR